jgi:myo-inositol-1(or 4)-monophosphatase
MDIDKGLESRLKRFTNSCAAKNVGAEAPLAPPPHLRTLSPHLEVAARAAAKAGNIIRESYNKLQNVQEKGVGDLVTDTDREADQAIHETLHYLTPSYGIISEEVSPKGTASSGGIWIVDPLDGTSAFVFRAGRQYPAVLIALEYNKQLIAGLCLFPLTGEWFYAFKGRGAYKNGQRLIAPKLTCSPESTWVAMNHYAAVKDETPFFSKLVKNLRAKGGARLVTHELPHSGLSLRLLDGTAGYSAVVHDNGPHNLKQGPWDIAAPQLIVEEAGGVFLNEHGDRVSPFRPEPMIICADRRLADWLRERARS